MELLKEEISKFLEKYEGDKGVQVSMFKLLKYLNEAEKINPDNRNLLEVIPYFLKLQNMKEASYGSSWNEYGHVSAFMNVDRKFARIRNIMKRVMKEGEQVLGGDTANISTETVMDTVGDMGVYCFLWITLFKETHPQMFDSFLKLNNLE